MAENAEEIKRNNKPIGASGTDVVGKLHNAEDHVALLSSPQAAEVYDKMRRSDPQVRKVLTSIMAPIKAAKWSVPPVSDDTKDIEVAALIEQILFNDINWGKFMHECITFVPHGFSAFEIVHENKINKAFGPYTGLAQLGYRKQSTITEWNHDEKSGKLLSIKQEAVGDIKVSATLPAENLLLFYNEQEGDNIGFPICRVLYGPYKRKLLATELQYIGMERNAINSPSVTVPAKIKPDDAEYVAAYETLRAYTSAENQFLMIPEGWVLDWASGNAFSPEKFEVVKKSEDEAMVGAIVATFLELGIGGNSGAYALGTDLSDFFFNAILNIANVPKDAINKILIPHLVEMNFADTVEVLPEIMYTGIADKAGKEMMEVITGYTKNAVITVDEALEDHVRKIHNLPNKAEGTQADNQETEDNTLEPEPTPTEGTTFKLADTVGHKHKYRGNFTGPAVHTGKSHFHDLLDVDGNAIGRTKKEKTGVAHTHVVDENSSTGKVVDIKFQEPPANDAAKLMIGEQVKIVDVLRRHMKFISDKFIADTIREYKNLPENRKLDAPKNVNIGGQAKFKRELQAQLTNTAVSALELAQAEVPNKKDVKLKDDEAKLLKEFGDFSHIKLNDFSKLPKRIQLLVVNQAGLLSEKESKDIADVVAFQFFQSEGSTNDVDQLKQDLQDASDRKINAGTTDTIAQDTSTLIVNETRQDFFFDDEVLQDIASFTYINSDPKAEICKSLAGTTFATNDTDAKRLSPGFHQNCKTYLRANLKTSKNLPDVTGLPDISANARASITLKECCS